MRDKLSGTTIGSVATGFAGQAATLVSGIIVARSLGVEGRGFYALIVLFPLILSQLGSLGLSQSITFHIAKNPGNAREVTKKILMIFPLQITILTSLHVIILLFYLEGKGADVRLTAFISTGLILGMTLQQYGISALQGMGLFMLFNVQRVLMPFLYTCFVTALYFMDNATLPNLMLSFLAAYIVPGCLTLIIILRHFKLNSKAPSEVPTLRDLYSFGVKGLLGSTTPMETFRPDQLVAGLFLSPAALGLYVVGQAFSLLPRLVSQSAGMVIYPIIAGHKSGFRAQERKLVWNFFWGVTIVNSALTMLLIFVMPYLLPLLFGNEFREAVFLAQILILGAFAASSRRIFVEGLRGMGYPQVSSYAEIVMYPWFLVAVPLFLMNFQETGLALSMTIGYVISLVFSLLMGRRVFSGLRLKVAHEI